MRDLPVTFVEEDGDGRVTPDRSTFPFLQKSVKSVEKFTNTQYIFISFDELYAKN